MTRDVDINLQKEISINNLCFSWYSIYYFEDLKFMKLTGTRNRRFQISMFICVSISYLLISYSTYLLLTADVGNSRTKSICLLKITNCCGD